MKNLILSHTAKKCIFVLSLLGSVNSTLSYEIPTVITESKINSAVVATIVTIFIGSVIHTRYQEDIKSNQKLTKQEKINKDLIYKSMEGY